MSAEPARSAGVRLTVRGALAVVVLATLLGNVLQSLLGSTITVGVTFLAGCLAAVFLVNPRDLLSLVVTPPLLFFAATLVSELVRALASSASMLQALGLGLFTSLSAGAPWLFAGSALVLGVAWRRGLPSNVRELREELRAARAVSAAQAAGGANEAAGSGGSADPAAGPPPPGPERTAPAGGGAYVPEPEGYFEPRVYGKQRDPAE
ncbi:DUF6542 domain-containing protein [Spongiactinospora sp. TRM90649]|uniref:DUF6542 domain-containing protein n=1 Tax=Spongiactinospora sp. TRM90649 TaxID=3031114 RepID=UPI0023F8DD7D|nr:DUF6542 domain-containing protein [Spongiactinospora sp. TRM90649]MDF5754706.1 hypothetical protein [Spongiactinospora sp. TRM90649]